jgi:hypothetical protein
VLETATLYQDDPGRWQDDMKPWIERLMRDSAPPGAHESGVYKYATPRAAFERVRDSLTDQNL